MATAIPPRPDLLQAESYDNIVQCKYTSGPEKRKYLNTIAGCADNAAALAAHNSMRSQKIGKGPPPSDLMPDEGLGILMSEVSFISRTASAFRISVPDFTLQYRYWIEYYKKRELGVQPTDSERLAAFGFLSSYVPARQDGEIWLFRNPGRLLDPYQGVNVHKLGNDLGLNLKKNEARLTFAFKATSVQGVAVPRFYDPHWEDLARWHWSGRTKPFDGVGAGFEEVVAKPPVLRDLIRPVIRLIIP